ncbi:MAG: lysophospholipid acyltransferase family protein [Gammaproteobacteria bacterium]|nr:lysophospholipid acyltransferase family protein [Gammaproteobacteria bacterium]
MNDLTGSVAVAGLWLLHWLPAGMLFRLGGLAGALLYRFDRSRRHTAERNIERCFPELNPGQRQELVRDHFRWLARGALSLGVHWWASRDRLDRLVRIEGVEHLRSAQAAGKNLLLLLPHFVGLEAGLLLTAITPAALMYKPPKNPVVDRAMRRARARFGARVVDRDAYLKEMLRDLRAGRPLLYLPDQNPGRKRGVFVEFFGLPACTHPGLARLADSADALVLMCAARITRHGFQLRVIPLPEITGTDVPGNTQRMNDAIETVVREMPAQYTWVHKRFKVHPNPDAATRGPGFYE